MLLQRSDAGPTYQRVRALSTPRIERIAWARTGEKRNISNQDLLLAASAVKARLVKGSDPYLLK